MKAFSLAMLDLEEQLARMRLRGLRAAAQETGLKEEFVAPAIQATREVRGPTSFNKAMEELDLLQARIDRLTGR
jgi:hypothetical protein